MGNKTKLLLLHGALGSKKQFGKLKPLLEKHFELIDLNFEGHGGLATTKRYSIQLFTDNVKDLLKSLDLEEVNIFGYSMGGYVALNLAHQNPELVGKIVTLGTKFDWTVESAAREVKMLNPDKIEAKVPHFAQKLKEEHHPLDWKVVMENTAQMMMDLGAGAALAPENLAQISQEVTIGIGSLDKMVSIEESERAAASLGKATLRKIDGFPHPIEQVDPSQLSEYILNALAS